MAHINGGRPSLGEQCRRFHRALPATDDEDTLVGKSLRPNQVTRVRAVVERDDCSKLRRDVGEWCEPEGEQDTIGRDCIPILEGCNETTVMPIESCDVQRMGVDALHHLEPVGILQVEFQGERLEILRRLAARFGKASNRVASRGIEVPVASRAQQHPFGHVLSPKRHGMPDHNVVDT